MCSGDDNDWVAADDSGTTPVKGIVDIFDCALPRQLVLGGFITPNNSSCGLSTRWKNIDDIALHSDKISHLTSTLLTCLQIIKHNIAYMSAVGAEYADVYFAT